MTFPKYPETLKHEVEQIRNGDIPIPRMAIFINSYKCNQNCNFCFHKPWNKGHVMSLLDTAETIDQLSAFGVKALDFCGGGESLCGEDMDRIFDYANTKGLRQCLITNGSLFKDDVMKKFIDVGSFVRISLDTTDRELYKKVHGVDMLPEVLKNLDEALKYRAKSNSKCEISVKLSLFKEQTHKSLEDSLKYLSERNIDSIQVKHLWDEKGKNLNDYVLNQNINADKNVLKMVKVKDEKNDVMTKPCWISPVQVTVDAYGDCYLCCYFQHRPTQHWIGNLLKTPFKDFWGSDFHREQIAKIRIEDCLKHDCRFRVYMKRIEEFEKKGTWDFM